VSSGVKFAGFFFKLQHQIRMYHWQTGVYARHKATDKLLESLDGLSDKFMEIYQGKYGKINLQDKKLQIVIEHLSDEGAVQYIRHQIAFLRALVDEGLLSDEDTDLLNIRDEIMGELNKTLYLFTFK
jgi:dihydroorotase